MAESEKNMPFALEAEQSVLGSILIDPEKFTEIADIISADDFYLSEHAEIFSAMQDLFAKNKEIDLVTLIDTLVKNGVYNEEESKKYIKIIAQTVPSAANVAEYAKIVKDKSTLRLLISAAEEIREEAFSAQGDVQYIVDNAEKKIFDVANGKDIKRFTKLSEAIQQTYARLDLIRKNRKAAMGTPTGYEGLDKTIVGLGPGDLVILGARPGMGKTSFALNIASNVAKSENKTVCVFSLEMSAEQLATRMLSSEALVNSYTLRSGNLQSDDWTKLASAAARLSQCNILIDDTSGITVTGMRAKLRRVKNLGLIVVDYLQLMKSEKKTENRVNEVSEISRGLKLMAKDFGVPCICCAQLSRSSAKEQRVPELSDLRESGSIEQDADIVMFLYSEAYYDRDNPEKKGHAQCIIAKNRHGETRNVKLRWLGEYTKFITTDEEHTE
ncbi:MAG: replicative DNA helicase [Eubacteriales bacterium]